LITKVEELADNSFPPSVRGVFGSKEKLFRMRVGDYRILCEVYPDENVILIVNIDWRSRVYG